MKKPHYAVGGAFMKEKKAFFFPMYNAGYASFRFHLMKAKQL